MTQGRWAVREPGQPGHHDQPVQDVLDEVLGISHDELHVRMDAGQDLAVVATDIGGTRSRWSTR